ncbi:MULTISPECIES: 4-hydroxy-tetrahydrodipicolinate synthase [unclassified Bacillus (in: firmicutes)]|uniref:4-hydroxy-tetrahydrodipicolinate synthase n=1 Tax=unclassified Bacillus (in: firmicutes) TaxID=185979 RepID=UPI002FFDC125
MYVPKGIIPALTTPFNEDGSIDFIRNKKLINHLIESGVHGVVVAGSTGEYTLLTTEERKELIKEVIKDVNGRVPVIAGTGCHRTEDTIALTQFAADAGAQSALILTPHYLKTTREGIVDYFKVIAANSSIGIIVYHYPGGTGVEIDAELIYELSQIDGVVGIKNTTEFDIISQSIDATKDVPNFSVLTGYQHTLLPTLAIGGHGTICVIPNLIPKEIVKMYDLIVKENDVKAAAELNKKLIGLYNIVDAIPFPGNLKAGLEVLGFTGGTVRSPLVPATTETKEKIREKLSELGYAVKETV